jgi:hypothetical protein
MEAVEFGLIIDVDIKDIREVLHNSSTLSTLCRFLSSNFLPIDHPVVVVLGQNFGEVGRFLSFGQMFTKSRLLPRLFFKKPGSKSKLGPP